MEIYNLYIKPLSDLEVIIPGKMRKKLVALFEVKVPIKGPGQSGRTRSLQIQQVYRHNSRGRFSTTVVELSRSRQSLFPERVVKKIDSRLLSPCFSCHRGLNSYDFQIELSDIKTTISKSKRGMRHAGITIALDEIVESSDNSTSVDLVSGKLSIAHLYPVWKTLVTLLRNDALVRFKNKHFWGQCNCGTTI